MTMRTGLIPELWPAPRSRPRPSAQRPLPSMTMATWCGSEPAGSGPFLTLHLQDLFLLRRQLLIDLADVPVGQLLDVILSLALIVLGDLLLLEQLLDVGKHVPAYVADADARILCILAYHLA